MKHLTRLFISLLLIVASLRPIHATETWKAVSARVLASVGHVTITLQQPEGAPPVTGDCAAFSIHESRELFLTAAHCDGDTLHVNSKLALSVYKNDTHDIMVLQVYGLHLPALRPASQPLFVGQAVAAYGYAYGWSLPFVKTGVVAIPGARMTMFGNRPISIFSFSFIQGMSGGPIVDHRGRVVSMAQQANRDGQAGMGIALEALLELTGQYWQDEGARRPLIEPGR